MWLASGERPWQAERMWTLLLASAAVASTTWTLEVPGTVEVGESIPIRVSITNEGTEPVRVPGDLAEVLTTEVRYVEPGGRNLPPRLVAGLPAGVTMDSVPWHTVPPGNTYTVQLVDAQSTGASVGTYFVEVRTPLRDFVDATVDVEAPRFLEVARVDVEGRLVLHGPADLPAQISGLDVVDGDLHATVQVVNTTAHAVWVPRGFLPQCDGSAVVRGKAVGFKLRTDAGGQPATLGEDELLLLAPGESVAHEVSCGAIPPRAKSLQVRVTLRPPSPAVPRQPESSRHVLEGSPITPVTFMSGSRLKAD